MAESTALPRRAILEPLRNRLLHDPGSPDRLDLSAASRPQGAPALCLGDGPFAQELLAGRPVALARWLPLDTPAGPAALLDRLQPQAPGAAPLRLALVYLHWQALGDAGPGAIVTPLLWLPVTLSKTKHRLQAASPEAEVNPALRQALRQSHGLDLPARMDARGPSLRQLHADLAAQISARLPGLALRWRDTCEPAAAPWVFDLARVTLGRFSPPHAALLRDYATLLDADPPGSAFDAVFPPPPARARREPETVPAALPLAQMWAVVPADAAQAAAVARTRRGASGIVLAPPGADRSLALANLIADPVGRGQRVLVVSADRGAIEALLNHLRPLGLDDLCAVLPDAPADVPALMQDLELTAGRQSAPPHTLDATLDGLQRRRAAVQADMTEDLAALQRFDAAMGAVPLHAGMPVRELVARLAALPPAPPDRQDDRSGPLPSLATWQAHAALARRLYATLQQATGQGLLAQHPFAMLGAALLRHERPTTRLAALADRAQALLPRCAEVLEAALPVHAQTATLAELQALVDHARRLGRLTAQGRLELMDAHSPMSRQLDIALAQLEVQTHTVARAAQVTVNWRHRLSVPEAQAALVQARQQELALMRWLRPSWRRLRADLLRRYDFGRHPVPPPFTRVLAGLVAEQRAQAAGDAAREHLRVHHGCDDPAAFAAELAALREDAARHALIAELHGQGLFAPPEAAVLHRTMRQLAALAPDAQTLAEVLTELLADGGSRPLAPLAGQLQALREAADAVPALLPLLQALHQADRGVADLLRRTDHPPALLEARIARAALDQVLAGDAWLRSFTAATLAQHVQRLAEAEPRWLQLNAQTLRAMGQHRPGSPVAAQGKRIRKAPGGTLRLDLKPVWLMSPQAVSDSLPLTPELFDLVVIDAAHQTPLEQAVPALYRAPQVLVLGEAAAAAHSLLEQAARHLPTTALPGTAPAASAAAANRVRTQLANALQARGHGVDDGVGGAA